MEAVSLGLYPGIRDFRWEGFQRGEKKLSKNINPRGTPFFILSI